MMKKNITKKVNVLLVEIINRNLGDTVIADSTEYILKKAFPLFSEKYYLLHHYNIYSEDYEMISRADLIIFAGGGIIKYRREEFYLYISKIIEVAEQKEIPVFFNGVGVEGYDEDDHRCQMLKNALNASCVKGISVRDDLPALKEHYMLPSAKAGLCQVADPAVFTRQVYGIEKKEQSNVIGLGVIRYRIFEDHGMPEIDKAFQLELWKNLIDELESRGYQCRVFVNGLKSDFDFAREVVEYAGKREELYLVPRPVEAAELVETIAGLKAMVAGRMHANIIAYALGIPSIGLVWNDKLAFWGKTIGYPERFVGTEKFQANLISDLLEKSIQEGIRPRGRLFYNSTIYAMQRFLWKFGQPIVRKKKKEMPQYYKWEKKLVAVALGGKNFQYHKLNDQQTMETSYKNGFRLFETDVRLTRDGYLVCINGWSKRNYEKLGVSPDRYHSDGMPYEEFMKCKWYGHYAVLDFVHLLECFKKRKGWKLMIDIGNPKAGGLNEMLLKLEELFDGQQELLKKIVVQVQTEYAAKAFSKSRLKWRIAYYLSIKEGENREERLNDIVAVCKKNKIKIITVSEKVFQPDVIERAHSQGLKVFAFSYQKLEEIRNVILMGADWVGTYDRNIKSLKELTQNDIG